MAIYTFADIIPCISHTFNPKHLKKNTLNVNPYLFPEFNFCLEIDGEENPTPFSKWFVQYDILNIINFQTNFSNYPALLDKYSERDLYL